DENGALLEEVDQVAGRQEHVVGTDQLENDQDRDQADHDGQHATLAIPDARYICPDVLSERLGDELWRNVNLCRLGGSGEVGPRLGRRCHVSALPDRRRGSCRRWSCIRRRSGGRTWTPCPGSPSGPGTARRYG